ncbi:MAG: bifunctional nuclease family protein [Bacteroidota bacterium]
MEKIKLNIVGLSYSQTQSGAYALLLAEEFGHRRLPIVIGGNEAQAIAIELEKMSPSRPLTHDLFKRFATAFDIEIREVIIYNLVEGIFFAKMVCKQGDNVEEIDARTSDAIAIAVRFNCPIYTYEFILGSAGIILEDEKVSTENPVPVEEDESTSLDELEQQLEEALANEDYELASRIRDEINKRKQN